MDEHILWEGTKQSLTNVATGGKVVGATYKITSQFIYTDEGVLRGSSEQIPLWAIRDLDVKQSIIQKARGVGDVVVNCEHNDYTGRRRVILESIEEPKVVRDLLNTHSKPARLEKQGRDQTVHYSGSPIGTPVNIQSTDPIVAASTPAVDPYERLAKLADLHKAGILTDEEFATQKARLLG